MKEHEDTEIIPNIKEVNFLFRILFSLMIFLFTLVFALPIWVLWKLDIAINNWKHERWLRKL